MTSQSSRPDRAANAGQAPSEATPLPVASQAISNNLTGSCAGLENPQTGELVLVLQVTLREPLKTPGGTQFMTDLAKWATSSGIAAIMGGRVVVVPPEAYELAQAGYHKATGKLPRPGWLQDAFLHPAQLLEALGGDALSTVAELVDAEYGETIDVEPAIGELRRALVEVGQLAGADVDEGTVDAIARRIAAALQLLEADGTSSALTNTAPLALVAGDAPPLPAWPPARMNFTQMADHAVQERDLRDLPGDGVEPAAAHLRNALQIMSMMELPAPEHRLQLRSIARLVVDALVAIEPRRA